MIKFLMASLLFKATLGELTLIAARRPRRRFGSLKHSTNAFFMKMEKIRRDIRASVAAAQESNAVRADSQYTANIASDTNRYPPNANGQIGTEYQYRANIATDNRNNRPNTNGQIGIEYQYRANIATDHRNNFQNPNTNTERIS